ncbi:MAG: hypothetical protein EZS28_035647 [Streblomastix strix]|uniref:Uncharacterized protein n=1 Tax=Streblomastix strix TaxID=222440 RepID=A0A5J4UEK8_9EUKA|nr:MAG: hypothetical protein EZS28_035647 [Streblomastix strix]
MIFHQPPFFFVGIANIGFQHFTKDSGIYFITSSSSSYQIILDRLECVSQSPLNAVLSKEISEGNEDYSQEGSHAALDAYLTGRGTSFKVKKFE